MLALVRLGDKTTHGGAVLTGAGTMTFSGTGVACKGDKLSRLEEDRGLPTIVEGNPNNLDQGIPVAFHGHKYGCLLISSFSTGKVA